jgi:hypothetical protein
VRQALFAVELLACACPQTVDRLAATASRETPKEAAFAAGRASGGTEGGSRTLTGVAHGALDATRLPFRHLDTKLRDKGSNLDLRVQSAVSCRLDDPGSCLSVQLPTKEVDAKAPLFSCGARHTCRASYVHATRLPFDPGSPAACVHVRGTSSSWRGFGAGVSYAAAKCVGKSTR